MEGAGGRVSLGDVAQQVLGLALPEEGAPILAKRKSVERKIDEAKREERDSHALSRAKRSLAVQAHRKLRGAKAGDTDAVLEGKLRKIATGGVIQLFNNVRALQREPEPSKQKKRERRRATAATLPENSGARPGAPLDMSKESFLDILRRGSAAAGSATGAAAARPGAAAPFLQDDFGLVKRKAKAKHWDNPADDEEEDEEEEGGEEAPDDFDDEGDEGDDESDDGEP